MADSPVFDWTSDALQRSTSFNSLQARGTVRLALKKAGLDATTVDAAAMLAVLSKLMPAELSKRGLEDAQGICYRLTVDLRAANLAAPTGGQKSPEDVFRRIFGTS